MNKLLNILFSASLILILASCGKDDPVNTAIELKLEKTSVILKTSETAEIKIESGNGGYTAEPGDSKIVTASVKDGKVIIAALTEGTTKITVTDVEKKTASIDITVTSATVIPNIATFTWNNTSVEFDKAGGYGISILSGSVALTDLTSDKMQYALSWEGGLTEGDKQNGKLVIAGSGKDAETVTLTSIKVIQANEEGNYLVFSDGSKSGELFFAK